MVFEPDQTVRIPPDVRFREVAGECVLLNLATEECFGLDPVGTRIWGLLAGGRTVGSAVEALLEEYDVEREVLEADVESLLDRLAAAGLLSFAD